MSPHARELRTLDWVLIATLLPLYLVTQAAQVYEGMTTGLTAPGVEATSASGPREFPVVGTVSDGTRFAGPRLAVGDRLLEVEGRSLAGASLNKFWQLAIPNVRSPAGARITASRGEERLATTLLGEPDPYWWSGIPTSLVGALVALVLLLRAPAWPPVRRFFVATLALCVWRTIVNNPTDLGPPGPSVVLSQSLFLATFPIGIAMQVSVYWDFTASARPLRAWMRALPWLFWLGLFPLTAAYGWSSAPIHTTWLAWIALIVLALGSWGVGLTRCYVRADALERRQIRWVVFGLYVLVVATVAIIATHLGGKSPMLEALTNAVGAVPPACILIAVLGYRFLDIDRLISATTSLTILGVLLLGVSLQLIPRAAEAASSLVGASPAAGQWALSLGFAAVAVQGHRWLRPRLDRWLFAERVAVEQQLAALVAQVAGCRTASELTALYVERIDAVLQPDSLVVYGRELDAFTPVFARGRAVPPAFAANSPLVRTLEERAAPLVAASTVLDPFDRAALATLGAEVVTPIRRDGTLVSFFCLGRKRTGDIYTPAELALLAASASASADVLRRIGDDAVLAEARTMQASLRRYVPGAIAQQLESGRDLQARECEVTVLFVDIRSYSRFAEKRPAEAVFSTVNEHTERVSRIVCARGGAVVEFNGDGMMAVFGAPEPLAGKERAAIEAAREIVDSSPRDIAVGVGIATGPAYAGNIRAADRWIWSVIGDTTNRAARLQSLTREIHASIAVDEPTRRAAGYVCADFARHEAMAIPGRSQRVDVFALPLAAE